jgi:perosamine synthetase
MKPSRLTRRQFVAATSLGSLAAAASQAGPAYANLGQGAGKLAVLGGKPVRTKRFSGWPIWDKENDEEQVVAVLRSGVWSRSKVVAEFETKYAELLGAKRCLATTNGTMALVTALSALGIALATRFSSALTRSLRRSARFFKSARCRSWSIRIPRRFW